VDSVSLADVTMLVFIPQVMCTFIHTLQFTALPRLKLNHRSNLQVLNPELSTAKSFSRGKGQTYCRIEPIKMEVGANAEAKNRQKSAEQIKPENIA